jgi:hypothetical protein
MKGKIAFWYKHGFWTLDMVRDAVEKKKINADEFKEITGKEYK